MNRRRELRALLREARDDGSLVCRRVEVFDTADELPAAIREKVAARASMVYVVAWRDERWACAPVAEQIIEQGVVEVVVALAVKDLTDAFARLEAAAA